MSAESRLEPSEHGLVPKGDRWFVLNAREAHWLHTPGRSAICSALPAAALLLLLPLWLVAASVLLWRREPLRAEGATTV